MSKSIARSAFLSILYGLVFLGIGYVIAILISNRSGYYLQDVLFVEGFSVIVIGILMSMKGNPSGMSLLGLGQQNAQQVSYLNLEVTRIERDKTDYYKNFLKHSVLDFAFSSLVIILGGVFIILFSIFFVN